jgi:hypothetical protein
MSNIVENILFLATGVLAGLVLYPVVQALLKKWSE